MYREITQNQNRIIYKLNVFIITKHTFYTFNSVTYIIFYFFVFLFFFLSRLSFFSYITQSYT